MVTTILPVTVHSVAGIFISKIPRSFGHSRNAYYAMDHFILRKENESVHPFLARFRFLHGEHPTYNKKGRPHLSIDDRRRLGFHLVATFNECRERDQRLLFIDSVCNKLNGCAARNC